MLWPNPFEKKSSNSEINLGFQGQFPLQRRNTFKAGWPWYAWCWQLTLKGRAHSDTLCPVFGSHTGGKTSAPGRIMWMISWFSSVPHYWERWGSGVGLQLSWKAVYSFKVIDLLLSSTYSKQVRRIHRCDIIFYFCPSIFGFKDLFTLFAGCSPGFEHVWSDTNVVKCKNKEPPKTCNDSKMNILKF